ncbi:hypothetical protein HpBT174_12200 [Helicobacter pylori]
MGLKNKIKGFIKERMPFVVRYVRSLNLFNHDHQESVFLAIASLNNESFIERNKSIYKNSSLNYNYGGGTFRR